MLNAKEGDTCIIKKADEPWWTEGKEYEVVLNGLGEACLVDDEGDKWEVNYLNNRMSYKLELKEKTFDLNKLTAAELREYVNLLENKEKSESLLNDFIERRINHE